MTGTSSVTPLLALDAVVIDTETTGLDPQKAWIVEIGAVRLVHGRLATETAFRRLVRPGQPIPPAATKIHSIDDAAVANAESFAQVWPELKDYIGDAVVIGHTVGFDLAVFRRECERAGIAWSRPRSLDTRMLAEVAEPDLSGFSLEDLSAWLGVEITDRHSALGDAMACARVFVGLLPKLRACDIRTLAEAERSCRALTDVLDEHHRAGWVEPVEAPGRRDTERTLGRIDSYPYRHRIRDLMSKPPKYVAAGVPLGEAMARMTKERISSLFVHPDSTLERQPKASEIGIITERDVMRALTTHQAAALTMPVEKLMSRPVAAVPVDAFVYRAIGRMNRLGVRHLGVSDETGAIVGALSARDLLRLRATEAVMLGDEIDDARDVLSLGKAWAKLPHVVEALLDEGVGAPDAAAVISRELGALTRQAAVVAEARMQAAGQGAPPCPYAIAVLGSGGRGESLLAMDQDNALIFAEGDPGGPEDAWFEKLAVHIADILHEVGVPYCQGGVMAKSPQWRGSVATWSMRVAEWIRRSNPRDLLFVDIFFDMRPVHGDGSLVDLVWRDGFDQAKGQTAFAKLLAESAGSIEPALNMFGGFKTQNGRIDLKKCGLFGIVTAARLLAICHHVVERSTPARLAGIRALGIGAAHDLDALIDAQRIFVSLVIAQQIEDMNHGTPPSNAVVAKRLTADEREHLKRALQSVQNLETLTRDLLFRA